MLKMYLLHKSAFLVFSSLKPCSVNRYAGPCSRAGTRPWSKPRAGLVSGAVGPSTQKGTTLAFSCHPPMSGSPSASYGGGGPHPGLGLRSRGESRVWGMGSMVMSRGGVDGRDGKCEWRLGSKLPETPSIALLLFVFAAFGCCGVQCARCFERAAWYTIPLHSLIQTRG